MEKYLDISKTDKEILIENTIMKNSQKNEKKKRVQKGVSTSNLIFSAYFGNNDEVFPKILELYVPCGSMIADVTYGKGSFWKKVPDGDYILFPSDIKTGIDCRNLPYTDESFDCVVFDPPYMEGFYRRRESHMAGNGTHGAFREHYSNSTMVTEGPKYHDAVVNFYMESSKECFRILKQKGIFIVKCQDEVSANRQRLTHVELINNYEKMGFIVQDLFITIRQNKPSISRLIKQNHARKNHSYFIVLQKK